MSLLDEQLVPLVYGSRLASRVAPGTEAGPLPHLFFSRLLDTGESENLRLRASYLLGSGSEGYHQSRRLLGATQETVYLIHTPRGDVALVVLDAPAAESIYDALGGARAPFHEWLELRALGLFDLTGGEPGPAGYGDRSEVLFTSATVPSSAA